LDDLAGVARDGGELAAGRLVDDDELPAIPRAELERLGMLAGSATPSEVDAA
jgi:hypothetical protein